MELGDSATTLTGRKNLRKQKQQEEPEEGPGLSLICSPSFATFDPAEHIRVSSFYEVDHSKLPSKSPDQLKAIRVVMVREKTRMRVSLRFPSIYSVRECFKGSNRSTRKVKSLPLLDEKCILGSETAGEVLYRRIRPEELAKKGCTWKFWAVTPLSTRFRKGKIVLKKGILFRELKGSDMVKWGTRRRVKYLARQVEDSGDGDHLKCVKEEEQEVGSEEEEAGSDKDEEMENCKSSEVGKSSKGKQTLKAAPGSSSPKKKRPKLEYMNHQIVLCSKQKKDKGTKNKLGQYVARWPLDRYKLAEQNILKIMKEVGAVYGNPILRSDLRAIARRLIGDTGLLDHLLKHMAGKVAPGGEDRFKRRHNSGGAMEYWLEQADLVDIRKEAGIEDPYWIPPPGWTPGDSPTQDPHVAREIKELKEDVAKLKMSMVASTKHDQELAIVAAPLSSVAGQSMDHESLLTPLKERYIDLINMKAKIEDQLIQISQSLCEMEEGVWKAKATLVESNGTKSAEEQAPLSESTLLSGKESNKEAKVQPRKVAEKGESAEHQEHHRQPSPTTKTPALVEDKAAKIARLRSGFRICKPQGTFLWPNTPNSSSSTATAQLEDLFKVPTPPSASSSTSPTQPHHDLLLLTAPPPPPNGCDLPPSPVMKPVPEKRPITLTLSAALDSPICSIAATTTAKTCLINLHEGISDQNDIGHHSTFPFTYQRRQPHNVNFTAASSCVTSPNQENIVNHNDEGEAPRSLLHYHLFEGSWKLT